MHGILVVKGFCWELRHKQILNVNMCLHFRPNGSSSVLTPISYIDEGKRYSRVSVREGSCELCFSSDGGSDQGYPVAKVVE